MKMWVYIVRRFFLLIPVIIGVMTITFLLVYFLPIQDKLISLLGPSRVGYDPQVPCQTIGVQQAGFCRNNAYFAGVHALGLDQPVYVQWAKYMYNSLTLNWGFVNTGSQAARYFGFTGGVPVASALSYLLPYTLELAILSLAITLAFSLPLGNLSAAYRNRPLDHGTRVLSFSGFAIPTFLFGFLLLFAAVAVQGPGTQCGGQATSFDSWVGSWPPLVCFAPSYKLPSWIGAYSQTSPTGFPTVDALIHHSWGLAAQSVQRMILPAIVIAFGTIASILRFVRNSMLEVMNLDFVRTARSKGVPERTVIGRHAGRNSLNVTITVLGLTFGAFISGFPIVEYVFNLRGVGLLLAYSVQRPYDFGLIFGSTLLFTFIVVFANLIVDVLYAYLDPRVRLG